MPDFALEYKRENFHRLQAVVLDAQFDEWNLNWIEPRFWWHKSAAIAFSGFALPHSFRGADETALIVIQKNSSIGEFVMRAPFFVGENSKINSKYEEWLGNVREDTVIGKNFRMGSGSTIHRGCKIGSNVTIGDNVVLQNGVHVEEGVTIGSNVRVDNWIFIQKENDIPDGTILRLGRDDSQVIKPGTYPRRDARGAAIIQAAPKEEAHHRQKNLDRDWFDLVGSKRTHNHLSRQKTLL
jgi:carbonic anhydrase/acetyltransferase-like protein (isoleucine patch superfamily)